MSPQPSSETWGDRAMEIRASSPSADLEEVQSPGSEKYKPDLSSEIAMLSTKLINAINYQTNLDDTLQSTQHDLEVSQMELKRVRAERQSLNEAIVQGVLVKKSEVEREIAKLKADAILEKEKREAAERAKRQTEAELENLTSSLFEEANKMVSSARKETEAAERRNAQLRTQLADTGTLLASQQEQLHDLKMNMTRLEHIDATSREPSIPGTPILGDRQIARDSFDPHTSADTVDVVPDHPLHFTHLLSPILRTDVSSYSDFADLLAVARKGALHSRKASGNIPTSSQTNLSAPSAATAANSSSPSLPGAFAFNSLDPSSSPSSSTSTVPALKDFKFYKRTLVEDIEPTLRLDLAPGLSFLSRRTVQSALLNGNLVVEPFTQTSNWKFYSPVFACALCGESRKTEPYVRRFRFRTSESDDAQRYPLCDYCLSRIRAVGDFIGFMRMVRDGHWKCSNEEEEHDAWEEAVKLRERMFWARIGGGVVPTGLAPDIVKNDRLSHMRPETRAMERQSLESIPEQRSRQSTVVERPAPVTPEEQLQNALGESTQARQAVLLPAAGPSDSLDSVESGAGELEEGAMLVQQSQDEHSVPAQRVVDVEGDEVVLTEPEAVLTEPEAVLTEPEAVLTEPEAVLTEPEAVLTEPQSGGVETTTAAEGGGITLKDQEGPLQGSVQQETPTDASESPPFEAIDDAPPPVVESQQGTTSSDLPEEPIVTVQPSHKPFDEAPLATKSNDVGSSVQAEPPAPAWPPANPKSTSGVLARVRAMEAKR